VDQSPQGTDGGVSLACGAWLPIRRLGERKGCFISSQDPTPAATPEAPSAISTVVHATDEEKLAVTSQKWTCMTVDLDADKQDFPQPSDLSNFVNETKFNSPSEGKQLGGQPDPHLALENTVPRGQRARKGTCQPGNHYPCDSLHASHCMQSYGLRAPVP
jgi:hypothetical protein